MGGRVTSFSFYALCDHEPHYVIILAKADQLDRFVEGGETLRAERDRRTVVGRCVDCRSASSGEFATMELIGIPPLPAGHSTATASANRFLPLSERLLQRIDDTDMGKVTDDTVGIGRKVVDRSIV